MMRWKTAFFRLGILAFAAANGFGQVPDSPSFTVQKLAKGVYAFIRKEPASLWFNPNNGLIVGKKFAVVIDSNISSEYTREVLAAIRKITDKPVKYVINTHWHEDHIIGNRVYRDAYPGVEFIGQRSTLIDLPTIGGANRKGSVENGQGFIDRLKQSIKDGKDLAGQPLSDEARAGYESDIRIVSSYLAEAPRFEILMPTILVDDNYELDMGDRKISIRFLGRAHTAADLVVFLPKESIAFTGDLLVWPVPLIGSTSHPLDYAETLGELKGLNAKTLIPGHGPVMYDANYIDQMVGLLDSIRQQVMAAVDRGETLEQVRKSVNLSRYEKQFCGDSAHKKFIFRNYVFLPATAAAFTKAKNTGH